MKYFRILFLLSLCSPLAAQKVWWEPADVNPNDSLHIFIDLSQMTCTNLYGTPDPLYMWTWSPGALDNAANGGAWSASNTADPKWAWTKRADLSVDGADVWEFRMVPTVKDFYGVTAQQVYDRDIKFLAKSFDGGSGGDCSAAGNEHKTEDLFIPVTPAFIPPPLVKSFPSDYRYVDGGGLTVDTDTIWSDQNDIFQLTYNQNAETDSNFMFSTAFGVFAKATFDDNTTQVMVPLSSIHTDPQTIMSDPDGDRIFKFTILPAEAFTNASTKKITKMSFKIYKGGSTSQTDDISYEGTDVFDYYFRCND